MKIEKKETKTIVWFAFRVKRRAEHRMQEYLSDFSEKGKILDVTVFLENQNNTNKKPANVLWPGMIFVKTFLIDGEIDKNLHEYIVDNTNFRGFYTRNRNYRSHPFLMSEKFIQKMIDKIQVTDVITEGKFTPDQINFKVHDIVTVLGGVFRGYEGEVTEINFHTGIITLNTEFFGRITPIQVGFSECKKAV